MYSAGSVEYVVMVFGAGAGNAGTCRGERLCLWALAVLQAGVFPADG